MEHVGIRLGKVFLLKADLEACSFVGHWEFSLSDNKIVIAEFPCKGF